MVLSLTGLTEQMFFQNLGMVIAAGGSGSRFSKSINKLLADYRGKPLLIHSLSVFLPLVAPGNMVVTVPADLLETMQNTVEKYLPGNQIRWTVGGASRLASVVNGIKLLPDDLELVAIHDAARPLATAELLDELCRTASEVGGAIPGNTPVDTIKAVDEDNFITGNPVRKFLAAVATPQVFSLQKYRIALSLLEPELLSGSVESPALTDDAAVFMHANYPVKVVFSDAPNPKITNPGDISR